jgi:Tol biopolymer transport system component
MDRSQSVGSVTFIEWDVTLCSCYGQKLRIREYKTGFDSTILISSEKTNLTSNSIAKMLDHTSRISKSLMYRHRMKTRQYMNMTSASLQVSRMSLVVSLGMFISVDYVVRE